MKETSEQLLDVLATAEPLLREMSTERAAQRPAPGKWSPKEIIGHLIDSACNNQQKFVRTMASPSLEFVGYAQDFWVSTQQYQVADWSTLIDLWVAYNRHLAHLIANVAVANLKHEIFIEGKGPYLLGFIMADYVEHAKHHLQQVFPDGPFESKFANVYNV